MKFLTILLILFGNIAFASEIAIEKAREAAMIQLGVQKIINDTQKYAEGQVNRRLHDWKIDKEVAFTAGVYKIVKEKTISFKLKGNVYRISTESVNFTHYFN